MSAFPGTTHREVAEPDLRLGSYGLSKQSPGYCPCSVSNLCFLKCLASSLGDAWQLRCLGKAPCSKWINLPFEALCLPTSIYWCFLLKEGLLCGPQGCFLLLLPPFFSLQTGELLTLLAPYMAAPFSHAFNGSFDVSCSCLAFPDMNVVFKLRWVYNLLPHL